MAKTITMLQSNYPLIKKKNFCVSKDTFHKVKRQPTEWEYIFANHISDKGLTFKIHKELLQCNDNSSSSNKTQFKNEQS